MCSIKWFLLLIFGLLYGVGGNTPKALYVSHKNDILRLDMPNSTRSSVVSADCPIVAFDIHQAWRQLFWATDYYIYRTPLYDLQTTALIAATGKVGSLAVDWVHHRVYWSDITSPRIESARLDGKGRRVVHKANWPIRALAVDPKFGRLFWIESSQVGSRVKRVKTSNLYGYNTRTIHVSAAIYEFSPLAIDVFYKNIYFYKVNGSLSEQWEVNYTGIEPPVKLFEREEPPPRSLNLANTIFYYSNSKGLSFGIWVRKSYVLAYGNRSDEIYGFKTFFKTVDDDLAEITQIRTADGTQHPWVDECSFHLCQHECIPSGKNLQSTTCDCRYGYKLMKDGRSCSENGYIMYTTGKTLGRMTLNGEEHTILYNDSSSNIHAFDVHVNSNYVYWTDLNHKAIYRAHAEQLHRKHVIVPDVSAYGVAVDWLYEHLYWTDHSRIMVSSLDGSNPMALLEHVDAPADLAVDPVNGYIFWAECGLSLSIRRASLSGGDLILVVRDVTCGVILLADSRTNTLFWLNWAGDIYSCDYSGSQVTLLLSEMAQAAAFLGHNLLYIPMDHSTIIYRPHQDNDSYTNIVLLDQYVRINALKVMSTSRQPKSNNVCEDADCPQLCVPSNDLAVPLCLCAVDNTSAIQCIQKDTYEVITSRPKEAKQYQYLEVIDTSPFSITLRCSGTLLKHPIVRPYVQITEVDSLVPRGELLKQTRTVHIADKSLPFKIDSLNPATSYKLTIPNRVTRAAYSMTIHTAPPPLGVKRLPVVTMAAANTPLPWHPQGVHFFSPNAWEDLVNREYVLLLVSKREYQQSNFIELKKPVLKKLKKEINGNFTALHVYKTEDQFDDDPVMYLGNIPWGEDFWLAMVQITHYKQVYNLDIVYSDAFSLSNPFWKAFVDDIFEDLSTNYASYKRC